MPHDDIREAKKVWDRAKEIVASGNIVKKIEPSGRRTTNFPGKRFNRVAHVRPHAKNIDDTYPLPVTDKVTGALEYTKHGFWLNNDYVLGIYLNRH